MKYNLNNLFTIIKLINTLILHTIYQNYILSIESRVDPDQLKQANQCVYQVDYGIYR